MSNIKITDILISEHLESLVSKFEELKDGQEKEQSRLEVEKGLTRAMIKQQKATLGDEEAIIEIAKLDPKEFIHNIAGINQTLSRKELTDNELYVLYYTHLNAIVADVAKEALSLLSQVRMFASNYKPSKQIFGEEVEGLIHSMLEPTYVLLNKIMVLEDMLEGDINGE